MTTCICYSTRTDHHLKASYLTVTICQCCMAILFVRAVVKAVVKVMLLRWPFKVLAVSLSAFDWHPHFWEWLKLCLKRPWQIAGVPNALIESTVACRLPEEDSCEKMWSLSWRRRTLYIDTTRSVLTCSNGPFATTQGVIILTRYWGPAAPSTYSMKKYMRNQLSFFQPTQGLKV